MVDLKKLADLRERAEAINTAIITAEAKKQIAEKRVQELLKEMGYDENMSPDKIQELIETLEKEEEEKLVLLEKEIIEAEEILKEANTDI